MSVSSEDESRMPLWQHLDELRRGLIRSLLAIGVGFAFTYTYSPSLMAFLEKPLIRLLPEGQAHLYFTGLTDKFVVYFTVCLLSSVLLVLPYLLYEFWRFISPALYRNEKRFLLPFLFFGTISFFLGTVFAYEVVIPYGYQFLIEFGSESERPIITLTSYFSLTLKLLFALGLVFELPVLLVLLGKMGLVDRAWLEKNRSYAFVFSAVIAAIATPSPDAFTMILVMVPLYGLYEIGILGVRLVSRSS